MLVLAASPAFPQFSTVRQKGSGERIDLFGHRTPGLLESLAVTPAWADRNVMAAARERSARARCKDVVA